MTSNGPEPTGFGLAKFAASVTLAQMCFGTTNWRFRTPGMNWESGVFRVMRTAYGPLALIEATLLPCPI